MINIRKTQVITYDNGAKNITVYFDFEENAKKYYIVPVPHLVKATEGDTPVFSLTRYTSNKGDVRGLCTFDVELYVPQDAMNAVKDELARQGKGDYVQGQLDWVSVNTFFKYIMEGEERIVNMVPSMYGENRVSFVILLDKDEDVTTFINAFNNGSGSVSPFSIEYDMTCLTKLVGVSAVVTYDAAVAITWENTYKADKDMWGNTRSVLAEVKKNLKQSGAGKVVISPDETMSEETKQRVEDWAWTTLEKMVSDSVTVATAAATSTNPIESTASFKQNYQENEVIEWSVKSSDNLPKFTNEVWAKLFNEVDLRQMVINFNLIGNFEVDSNDGVDKVDVTVTYDGAEPITHTLQPKGGNNSFTYKAPGAFDGNNFISTFKYRYKVYFKNVTKQPYESDIIDSSDTIVNITPSLLGIQNMSFTGSNIPFTTEKSKFLSNGSSTVDRLIIDLYFNRPEGTPNKTEQKQMTANNVAVTFSSFYVLPIENTYVYKLTYLMSDGREIIIDPVRNFGADNSSSKLLNFPLTDLTFTVNARKDGDELLEWVLLDVDYVDPQNAGEKPEKSFEPWETVFTKSFLVNPEKWQFQAVKNPDGAYYEISGNLLYAGYEVDIRNYKLSAKSSSYTIFTDKEQFSVEIDWNQVDWSVVANVEITLFQTEGGSIISPGRMKEIFNANGGKVVADPKEVNKQSYPLLKSDKPLKPRLIYNVTRDHEYAKFEYWMGVIYNQRDGTKLQLKTEKTDAPLFTLPKNGNTMEAHISFISIEGANPSILRKPRRTGENQIKE